MIQPEKHSDQGSKHFNAFHMKGQKKAHRFS